MTKPPFPVLQRGKLITDGLVGCWQFYEGSGDKLHDACGRQRHAMLTNMDPNTDWIGGRDGWCLDFDSTNDHALVSGALSDYSFIQNLVVFELSVWVKINNLTTRGTCAVNNAGSSTSKGFLFLWENSGAFGIQSFRILITRGGGGTVVDAHSQDGATITDNNWHHVSVSGNGSTIRFLVDGVIKATTYKLAVTAKSSGDSTNQLAIGIIPPAVLPFDGQMDDFRIYNRQLSQDEIAQIYAGHG